MLLPLLLLPFYRLPAADKQLVSEFWVYFCYTQWPVHSIDVQTFGLILLVERQAGDDAAGRRLQLCLGSDPR